MSKVREKEANDLLIKNGMNFIQPDAAMKAAYMKVGDQMLEEWKKTAGADGEAIIKAYRK